MTFQITPQLQSLEDANRASLDAAVKSLEKYLRKIHVCDFMPNPCHKQAFWLMDGLVRYNIRRLKLFQNASKSDLTLEEWVEFDKDILETEKFLIDAIIRRVNEKKFSENDFQMLKNYFWLMDGFIKFKLRHCKFYAVKNNIENDISDEDTEVFDNSNPLFNEPVTLKINRKTLTKLFGSKISKQVKAELMKDISESADSLEAVQSMIENNYIDTGDANLDLLKRIANPEEIMVEHKSHNPLNREIKSANPFLDNNPLANYNCFTKNNPMLRVKSEREILFDRKKEEKEEIMRLKIENPKAARKLEEIENLKLEEKKKERREKQDLIKQDLKMRKDEKRYEIINNLYDVYLEQLILDYRKYNAEEIATMSIEEKARETERLKEIAWRKAREKVEMMEEKMKYYGSGG